MPEQVVHLSQISGWLLYTVVSACPIGQFGPIFLWKTSDGVHLFLLRATEKIKMLLDQKITQRKL